MKGIDKILAETSEKLGINFLFCSREDETDAAFLNKQKAEEGVTVFKFFFHGEGYVCGIEGTGKTEEGFAALLPAYLESFGVVSGELSKTEYLKRILLGECSLADIYKYMLKYAVKNAPCFVVAIRAKKLPDDTMSLITQYGGNSMDTAVRIDEHNCALVKFLGEEGDEYRSVIDYTDFLAQLLQEELGLKVTAGIGSCVKSLKDAPISYLQASSALRYTETFSADGGVHSYKEYMLIKMLEDVPEYKLNEYLSELIDEKSKEIFDDEEMLLTAEEFLQNSLNVSETSRKLYMHRNTLLYRLDKIEKASGLNIREFPQAVSFRVLTILHKLLKK